MKKTENSIENEKSTTPVTVITTTPNILPFKANISQSSLDLMFYSSQEYSSRVWDAVKADILEHIEEAKKTT